MPVASRLAKRVEDARWSTPDYLSWVRLPRGRYGFSGVFDDMTCRYRSGRHGRFCVLSYAVTFVHRQSGTSAGAGVCSVGVTVVRTRRGALRARGKPIATAFCGPYPDSEPALLRGGILGGVSVPVHRGPASLPTPVMPSGVAPPVADPSAPPPIAAAAASLALPVAQPPAAHAADLDVDLGAYVGYQGPFYAQEGTWYYLRWYDFRQTAFGLNSGVAYVVQWYYAYNGAWHPWFQNNLIRQTCQGGTGWDWSQTIATC
jgi:hypothetical protein